ncbi:MAG: hypothetical protein V1802_02105 [Candidatus Aenigmatarchaeota archaeon]
MTAEKDKTIVVPQGFSYGRTIEPFIFLTKFVVDKGVGNAYERANASLPRAFLSELYCLGRDLELKLGDPGYMLKIPKEAQELARFVFNRMQERRREGVFHNDYVLFEPGHDSIRDPLYGIIRRPGKDYIAGRLFHDAVGDERGGKFDVIGAKMEKLLWFPPEGKIVPGTAYDLNTQFGFPDATEKNEGKAREKIAEKYGISDKKVAELISTFHRNDDGYGWFVASTWSSINKGPDCVSLSVGPLYVNTYGGSGSLTASWLRNCVMDRDRKNSI